MMLALTLSLSLAVQDSGSVAEALASYRALTRAEVPCDQRSNDDEIVVCARREADKFRLPLIPSRNAVDSVPQRTADLTKDYSQPICGEGAFLIDCGSVGVSATVSSDGKVRYVERERAP